MPVNLPLGAMEGTAQCQCGSLRAIASGEPAIVNVCTARHVNGERARFSTRALTT
jgi:hypothetical protein